MLILISLVLTYTGYLDNINDVSELKWLKRVLIVIEDNNLELSKNCGLHIHKFIERDFILVSVVDNKVFLDNKLMPEKFSKSIYKKIEGINKQHDFVLIGKDGTIKKTYQRDIDMEVIFFDVDKMPMRKYEKKMKKK